MPRTVQSRPKKLIWVVGFSLCVGCELTHAESPTDETRQLEGVVTDFTFRAHDNTEMFGRLVLPGSTEPRAVVIYVQTAEGMTVDVKRSLGNDKTFNYFDLYRETLTAMGIGFFSYEGRGIRMGNDPPRYETIDWKVYNTSTLENKVRDVLSAIDAVRHQNGLQRTPVLLMGASEGTLLAAEAAARSPESVTGLVLYGALVSNLRETFTYLMGEGEFLRYRPLDEDKNGVISKAEWDNVVKGTDFSNADRNNDGEFTVADVKLVTKKYLDAVDAGEYEVLQAWAKAAAAVSIPDGWFEDHFDHADSWTFLSRLDMPIAFFHGDADNLAPLSAVEELESKVEKSRLTNFEFHYFEGLGHSLNIAHYFINGELPEGHQAIFEFIDRIVSEHARE